MRKVKFKKWIPPVYIKGETTSKAKEGTGCLSNEIDGRFHCWGYDAEYGDETIASFSIAIIEDVKGQVHTTAPERVRFVD